MLSRRGTQTEGRGTRMEGDGVDEEAIGLRDAQREEDCQDEEPDQEEGDAPFFELP